MAEAEANLKRIAQEMHEVWCDRRNDPTAADWRRIDKLRALPHDAPERITFKGSDAWRDAIWDSVEIRWFLAGRRVKLLALGLDDAPFLSRFWVTDQPDRLGVLMTVLFQDRFAAIDFGRSYDALYAPETAELYRLCVDPAKTVAKWLAKRTAMGRPWVAMDAAQRAAWDAETKAGRAEYHRLRKLLYPTKDLRRASLGQRAFTREELHATVTALEAYRTGEPLSVEEQVRTLDLSTLSPIEAYLKLQALQAEARRLDTNSHFLPVSMGGFLLPPEHELIAAPQPPA